MDAATFVATSMSRRGGYPLANSRSPTPLTGPQDLERSLLPESVPSRDTQAEHLLLANALLFGGSATTKTNGGLKEGSPQLQPRIGPLLHSRPITHRHPELGCDLGSLVEGGKQRCDHRPTEDVLVLLRAELVQERTNSDSQVVVIGAQQVGDIVTVMLAAFVLAGPEPLAKPTRNCPQGSRLNALELLASSEVALDHVGPSSRTGAIDAGVERPNVLFGLCLILQNLHSALPARRHFQSSPGGVLAVHPIGLAVIAADDQVNPFRVERSSDHRLDQVVHVGLLEFAISGEVLVGLDQLHRLGMGELEISRALELEASSEVCDAENIRSGYRALVLVLTTHCQTPMTFYFED